MATASRKISYTLALLGLFLSKECIMHPKSVCIPSSREMSSFAKDTPGSKPRFLSQKMAQKDPLKNRPSTATNATTRVPNELRLSLHHLSAQSALRLIAGKCSIARRHLSRSSESVMRVSSNCEYISPWMFSIITWKPRKHLASVIWTSAMNRSTKFSLTIPSLAAKKLSTCFIKYRSFSVNFGHCCTSFVRSTSSAVQKLAIAFLYISHTLGCFMGKTTKRSGFSSRSGSAIF